VAGETAEAIELRHRARLEVPELRVFSTRNPQRA
jgi:hypothetical protein